MAQNIKIKQLWDILFEKKGEGRAAHITHLIETLRDLYDTNSENNVMHIKNKY